MKKSLLYSIKIATILIVMFTLASYALAQVPPSNLAAVAGDSFVDLTWGAPDFGFWLHWDTGGTFTGIGTGTEIEFKTAIRFPPDSLNAFNVGGRRLTEVMFLPRWADCDYSVNVWVGGTPTNPNELVVNQLVQNPVMNAWNTVILQNPVRIDPTQELWIGINYDTRGGHPAGCDNGPEVDGFSNLIFINNAWQTLMQANPDLTYNWNIRGFVGPIEGRGGYRVLTDKGIFEPEELADLNYPQVTQEDEDEVRERVRRNTTNELLTIDPDWSTQRTSGFDELYRNDVLGFNIYRDDVLLNDELLDGYRFIDRTVVNYELYTYTATALYRSGESRMSNEVEATPKLPKPFDLTGIGGEGVARLRWDAYDHPDLLGFNLYKNHNLINDEPLFNTRYNDEDVENGVLYSYYVKSVYEGGIESDPSNIVAVRPEILETPHNLEAVVGDGIVYLRWEAPENENVLSYILYREHTVISRQSGLTYFDTNVENNIQYTYYVSAVYPQGESSPSEPVQVTPEVFVITPAPHSLAASALSNSSIRLEWETPKIGRNISWDSGQSVNTFGTGSAFQFRAAARFTPFDLIATGAGGKRLTEVSFYPTYFNATYTINVWVGGTASAPEDLVVQQPVNYYELNEWNYIVLNTPVQIDATRELWIGVAVSTPAGRPMGGDAGPAKAGYGNMIFYNNAWAPLTNLNPAYNYNWNIQGFVSFDGETGTQRLSRVNDDSEERRRFIVSDVSNQRNLDPSGYNIYRGGEKINVQPVTETFYVDRDLAPENFYEYYVTAVYEERESEPSNYVLIELLGSKEELPQPTVLFNNYPNPFNPSTTISYYLADETSVVLTIFNIAGQKINTIVDEAMKSGKHSVVWDGRDSRGNDAGSGIYFYRLTTGDYTSIRKMIMIR